MKTDTLRVMVVGCAPGSFGHYVADAFGTLFEDHYLYPGWSVVRADKSALGQYHYDVTDTQMEHERQMSLHTPHHVIYAVGMNEPDMPARGTIANSASDHFELNVAGFLRVAEAFQRVAIPGSQLVAVSSNSARIPRSPSVGYCASKAALSMAVRVLARRWKGKPIVWGIEPGLMDTEATRQAAHTAKFTSGPLHRMPGVTSATGLSANQLAENLAHSVMWGGHWQNGTLQAMDAGEL